jgi:two-component system, response regulator PdtaR
MDRDALKSKAILVVEDETLIRLWAADLLEENGFSVIEAKDADAALKVLECRPDVNLLFTDVLSMEWNWLERFMRVGPIFSW